MAKVTYGKHTYGTIQAVGRSNSTVTVGKYCSIAKDVKALMCDDHQTKNISTYPFGHGDREITHLIKEHISGSRYKVLHKLDVTIGNDVWLGYGAILFRGVTIGDGAVIGALAKITKDVAPYSIVVGNDRVIRQRFHPRTIDFLLNLKWWEFPDEEVAEIAPILVSEKIEDLKNWAKDHGKL